MSFRRDASIRNSIIFIVLAVIVVVAMDLTFKSRLPVVIVATLIVGFLEFSRYQSHNELYKVVFVDELTELPNLDQMKKFVESKIKNEEMFFVAVFDIKNFKLINELWGYDKGDEYLRFIGEKIKEFSDVFDFACRCENDNFMMIIKHRSMASAMDIMNSLFNEIDNLPGNDNYHVQFSCGMVQQDGNYNSVNVLIDCAKIAKAISKKDSQTKITVYDEIAKEEMIRRQQLKDHLYEGLKNHEFLVYLQPKYNLEDESLAGAEALIRWNYNHETLLSPAEFIPVFEEDGSIGLIDQYVLRTVSSKIKAWQEMGYKQLPVSINISRVQLTNRNLVKNIVATVESHDIPFSCIDLELTESAAFDNINHLLVTMNEIKRAGFTLSMDDFGTGYSSLGLLREMPLDILKLDKSFIDGYMDENCEKERLMIQDIISMAHHLEIKVIAEGVETKKQKDMLKNAGCEIVQGFYYSKPIPIEEYEELLKKAGQVETEALENIG